jgi:hypothetical protein
MTSHPPDPAEWESPPQGMLARDGRLPAAAWPGPGRPPPALAGWPGEGYPGDGYPADSYPASGYYHGGDPAADYLPDYPPMPGYPPLSDHPSMPGYPPLSDHPSMPGYPPLSDHPSMPGYPPLSDHPSMPGYPPLSDHPSMPGYPPAPEQWPDPNQPADSHVNHDEYLHPRDSAAALATAQPVTGGPAIDELPGLAPSVPAPPMPRPGLPPSVLAPPVLASPLLESPVPQPAPARAGTPDGGTRSRARPVASEDAHWAMLAYLTVPIFGCIVSLAIYLLSLRGSRWLRAHAAQALNVWLTWLLYNLSALIVGGLLALDSARVALTVVLPVAVVLWLTILGYLVRAARLASRGREYALPHWLCSQIIR